MFGIRYAKFEPSRYVFRYQKGQLIAESEALSGVVGKWASEELMPARLLNISQRNNFTKFSGSLRKRENMGLFK
jgi:hypothetical protein